MRREALDSTGARMTARVRTGLDGIVEALAWSDDAALARELDDEFVATRARPRSRPSVARRRHGGHSTTLPTQPRNVDCCGRPRSPVASCSPTRRRLTPPRSLRQADRRRDGRRRRRARDPPASGPPSATSGSSPTASAGRWPTLGDGRVPLDFGSPWATRIDLSGREEFADRSNDHAPTPKRWRPSTHRITAAWRGLDALDPTIVEFVRASTTVIVLQAYDDAPQQVSSGTNGIYVGRTFITNAHRDGASVEALAEAIVHESIHGCLQRDVLDRPFTRALDDRPAIASPWTGPTVAGARVPRGQFRLVRVGAALGESRRRVGVRRGRVATPAAPSGARVPGRLVGRPAVAVARRRATRPVRAARRDAGRRRRRGRSPVERADVLGRHPSVGEPGGHGGANAGATGRVRHHPGR